ncbi:N-acetyltransferase eso1 [Sphaceloma murrayae]|uniref:DNA polymerase eta n=1 Tax=Sphaceloma murrayae TaxID=2082308 RepID=A0A2K1QSA5_9PEZI|nr:N-acetyltransferase eso1 [Sphaceloma murrayae]
MSSQRGTYLSSPLSTRPPKSKFTYKHLSTLLSYSTTSPLRCIAHIDLDAFYAQCEQVRLNLPPSTPLAVQQWQGLIAINYPARAFGLSRHVTCHEARKACPDIILQHVATWREGDAKWAYHEDAFAQIATHKVSLDPYRMESRRILAVIKEVLPATQRVEKASIDEVFVDLSAQVHGVLMERFPELRGPPPYDDPTERLPRPPTTAIDWAADALVDLDDGECEEKEPDWDDVVMGVASEIVRRVRREVWEKLKYTCSAGVAKNKMLAKLGSGHKKPNSQTIVRNRAVQQFLSGFKFTKIRNLGGKLGDEVVAAFNTDTVEGLLEVGLEQMKKQLGDDTGQWLYGVIRGEDQSEVNPRTQIKSMLSAKSFRPSINSFDVGCKWLRIFVADIFSRLVEEGVLDNKRRPKTINLHHRQGGQMRSKQAPIPTGKAIDEETLFNLAKNLLGQVVVDGRAWPCANLSLSVGGFEDGVKDNKGIGGFLVRGEEAKAMYSAKATPDREDSGTPPPGKRRRIDEHGGIRTFFGAHREDTTGSEEYQEPDLEGETEGPGAFEPPPSAQPVANNSVTNLNTTTSAASAALSMASPSPRPDVHAPIASKSSNTYLCDRCQKQIRKLEMAEHEDWHFAREMQRELSREERQERQEQQQQQQQNEVAKQTAIRHVQQTKPKGRGRPPGNALRSEKGQSKLAFG